jgi:hypothetical protein
MSVICPTLHVKHIGLLVTRETRSSPRPLTLASKTGKPVPRACADSDHIYHTHTHTHTHTNTHKHTQTHTHTHTHTNTFSRLSTLTSLSPASGTARQETRVPTLLATTMPRTTPHTTHVTRTLHQTVIVSCSTLASPRRPSLGSKRGTTAPRPRMPSGVDHREEEEKDLLSQAVV